MTEQSDPGRVLSDLRAAAEDVGALVVPALVKAEGMTVGLESADLVALIRHVRPRLVYIIEERFDAGDHTLDRLAGEDGDPSLLERGRVKALVKAWRKRDGELSLVAASVAVDGVLHGLIAEADWLGEHEAAVEAIEDEAAQASDEAQRKRDKQWKARFSTEVKTLLADPRFTVGRPSAAKRKHLAETLFPHMSSTDINGIVTMAENDLWLSSQ